MRMAIPEGEAEARGREILPIENLYTRLTYSLEFGLRPVADPLHLQLVAIGCHN